MRKGQIFLYVFLTILLVVGVSAVGLFVCDSENFLRSVDTVERQDMGFYTASGRYLYVGGAVEKSGWIFVYGNPTYGELLDLAGKTEQTAVLFYAESLSSTIDKNRKVIIFDYSENGKRCPSLNVNSRYFAVLAEDNLESDAIAIIEGFKSANGFFESMWQLKNCLGEELYSLVYFKLYIGENV